MNETERQNARVTLCSDGKYRWVHEMSLFKNPTFFFLVWKIFFFIILGIFLIATLADLRWGWESVRNNLKIFGWILLGMTALVALGYAIYAAIMGGKYIVEFEMDEQGILHRQIERQAEKAKKIGKATMVAGLAAGRPSTVGAGLSAQRTEMYSAFAKTRKVKAFPRRSLIKVNGLLSRNQVYTAPEDFDFVAEFIRAHCPNLKK